MTALLLQSRTGTIAESANTPAAELPAVSMIVGDARPASLPGRRKAIDSKVS
jgi:hypothetical protein